MSRRSPKGKRRGRPPSIPTWRATSLGAGSPISPPTATASSSVGVVARLQNIVAGLDEARSKLDSFQCKLNGEPSSKLDNAASHSLESSISSCEGLLAEIHNRMDAIASRF